MAKKLQPIVLTTADDIFSVDTTRTDTTEHVIDVTLEQIHDFRGHPFQVRMDAEMLDFIESIKEFGVLEPGIARPRKEGGYELIAGHRRKLGSREADLSTMPLIVREMDDDAATVLMVESNRHREKILPSERANSLKMLMDALNRQGQRILPTSPQVGESSRNQWSVGIAAGKTGITQSQIHRFIRLTFLTPTLLQMTDDGKLAFNTAVELSYLREHEQMCLQDWMMKERRKPSLKQAEMLKAKSRDNQLDVEQLTQMVCTELPKSLSLPMKSISSFFPPDTPLPLMQETIINLLAANKSDIT